MSSTTRFRVIDTGSAQADRIHAGSGRDWCTAQQFAGSGRCAGLCLAHRPVYALGGSGRRSRRIDGRHGRVRISLLTTVAWTWGKPTDP